jgi:hypothetical protein
MRASILEPKIYPKKAARVVGVVFGWFWLLANGHISL